MKKKLRAASLILLVIGIVFVICAVLCMDVPIELPIPLRVLKVIYKIYPIVTVGLFAASFFVRGDP